MRLILFEFFAGSGAVRLALGDDWRCAGANDHDPDKASSYRANFGDAEFRLADIADLTAADLPGHAALAWASPPCVDLSLAGRRAGLNAEHSGCFWPFARLMQELVAEGRGPTVIAVENVAALLSSNGGADFAAIVEAFAALGYMVGALEIDAALFLPQSRRRLFIVCARAPDIIAADVVAQRGPSAPFHSVGVIKAHERLPAALRVAWIWWRLSLPPPRQIELCDVLEPVRGDPDDLARVLEIMAPTHRAKLDAAVRARRPGEVLVIAANRRMRDGERRAEIRLDGLANALRCAKGGSSIQTLIVADDLGTHARKITPREAARLMGLPDGYRLPANVTTAHDLVGDGVCVPVVRWLAQHLLAPIVAAQQTASRPRHAQASV